MKQFSASGFLSSVVVLGEGRLRRHLNFELFFSFETINTPRGRGDVRASKPKVFEQTEKIVK